MSSLFPEHLTSLFRSPLLRSAALPESLRYLSALCPRRAVEFARQGAKVVVCDFGGSVDGEGALPLRSPQPG
eukprot:COSAG04_NODE_809_length_10142_cov_3.378174_6_plen_72_part_00